MHTLQVLQTHDLGGGEQKNTHNNVIEVETRIDMTVDTDQQHQKIVEEAANMIF